MESLTNGTFLDPLSHFRLAKPPSAGHSSVLWNTLENASFYRHLNRLSGEINQTTNEVRATVIGSVGYGHRLVAILGQRSYIFGAIAAAIAALSRCRKTAAIGGRRAQIHHVRLLVRESHV